MALKYKLGFVLHSLPGDERFTGSISLPYMSPSGPLAIKYRDLTAGGAKYAKARGEANRLYNTDAYFYAGNTIGICEGEVDAIVATEVLHVPSLGVPGVEGWKDLWGSLMKDFTRVLIFADGDEPGKQFAYKMADSIGWRAQIVQSPDGEDVSSMVASGRADELLAVIRTSNQDGGE